MSKNEIHARLPPELMEALKRICSDKGSNLSDVTRAALVLYVDAYECLHLFEHHKFLKSENSLKIGLIGTSLETTRATPDLLDELVSDNDSVVQLIEQELEVFFARCRDECEPEDGELYWFWFESKNESSWRFDADSPNNWCPTKRFNSRESAIRNCLKEKLVNPVNVNALTETLLPSLNPSIEPDPTEIIDW